MRWKLWLALLLLVGSILGANGELVLATFRGEVDILSGIVGFVGNWVAGFYNWDRIGVNALSTAGADVVAKLTVGLVMAIYLAMFILFYKIGWHIWDLLRRKAVVSKTRAKMVDVPVSFVIGIIMMGIFTWGFEFPRALLGAIS